MSQQPNFKEIQQKLYEKLKPSGWGDALKLFLLGTEFTQILEILNEEKTNGERFVPQVKYLFRAFEECPLDKTQIVILGSDPYPYPNVPDGIAFSCSLQNKTEASLKQIQQAIAKELGIENYTPHNDLAYLANQGILLLNTALTVTIGKAGSHVDLWEPFMKQVFEVLNKHDRVRAYAFLGGKAKPWSDSVPNTNFKFFTSHPAAASYAQTDWDSGNMFKNLDQLASEKLNLDISW